MGEIQIQKVQRTVQHTQEGTEDLRQDYLS